MKISLNWLNDYLESELESEEISEILTNIGLEVEKILPYETIKGGLDGIYAGKVLTCSKHPNADRLKVTTIDMGGKEILEIVCGAPNIDKGQIVPVAKVGSKIYTNDGDEIKIKKSKIRDVVSNGMVCAEDEIGLGNSHDGIMILDKDIIPGTPLSQIFKIKKDNIFEIGLTPNRCDAMSHYGVARDLKAYLDLNNIKSRITLPSTGNFESIPLDENFRITIDDNIKCPFYSGLIIKNIKVSNSSKNIQDKLMSIGLKPINNVVDITNYVMHEIGQPLHAFDFDKIDNISVKSLKSNTEFKTLDQSIIKLNNEDLMICSNDRPLCLAGIYGGFDSGVNDSTTNIFLESAIFDSISIRKSSKRHQLYTDASYRYERGVDPEKVIYALKRAANIIKEDNPECIISDIIIEDNLKLNDKSIYLRYKRLDDIIGKQISKENITQILNSLDFEIKGHSEDGLNLISPQYRHDVTREIDVIEEILRVYGYNNVEIGSKLTINMPKSIGNNIGKNESLISNQLIGIGFNEVINNSICSPSENKKYDNKSVNIINPQGVELSNLRLSLIPNLLETIKHNINRQNRNIKIFEFGKVYHEKDKSYTESNELIIGLTGEVFDENWMTEFDTKNNYYFLKGVISNILNSIGIINFTFNLVEDDLYHFKNEIKKGKLNIGSIGELGSSYLKEFSIDQKIFICNLKLDLIKSTSNKVKYSEISKYPSSRRDISMILDNEVSFDQIKKLSFDLENKVLKDVNLFDEYKDSKIGKGKKSFAISFIFNDSKKTLTDQLIDKIMAKLIKGFVDDFKAEIRDK
ncbi:MAG: phenylalanine--tRNA ligase subunit beta [Bacteroidota bacterium]